MKPAVLYLSYTGLLDPLGQSQVLQYVIELAREHRMTLLTFEKPAALRDAAHLHTTATQCREAGIDWHYLTYHNRPNLPATLYDVAMGAVLGARLARRAGAQVVHCRSYLAALMGLWVRRRCGTRHLFDMRGFWPDERVDGGLWRRQSLRYRLFKRLERRLFTRTDHVVSLTEAGAVEIRRFDYLARHLPPVTVIPTCTNLALFAPGAAAPASGFTLGYVGSAGSWYLFEQVALAVKLLLDTHPDARFLMVTRDAPAALRRQLQLAAVDLARVEILSADYRDVARQIARMDAGIFFIKPVWSKLASCPTRLGEFLAAGKPCLANRPVGDVEAILGTSRTGVVVADFAPGTLASALAALLALAAEPGIAQRCRDTATRHFSLQAGVAAYAAIYARLADSAARAAP